MLIVSLGDHRYQDALLPSHVRDMLDLVLAAEEAPRGAIELLEAEAFEVTEVVVEQSGDLAVEAGIVMPAMGVPQNRRRMMPAVVWQPVIAVL